MPQKTRDLYLECNDRGMTEMEFQSMFCNYCRQTKCDRSGWSKTSWEQRINSQVERLILNPNIKDQKESDLWSEIPNFEPPPQVLEIWGASTENKQELLSLLDEPLTSDEEPDPQSPLTSDEEPDPQSCKRCGQTLSYISGWSCPARPDFTCLGWTGERFQGIKSPFKETADENLEAQEPPSEPSLEQTQVSIPSDREKPLKRVNTKAQELYVGPPPNETKRVEEDPWAPKPASLKVGGTFKMGG